MQTSSQPKKIPVPFADAGSKQDIPVASQIGITGGRASYTDGFPPLTRTPLSAGGIPPFGTDFNGVLNDITAAVRWQNAGSSYPFDAAFAASISGYPKGAVIPTSAYDGYWLNTVDANVNNPEVSNASLTGWVPTETYGVTAISGLSSSSVTLTNLQAAKDRIKLTGTLTSNINLIVPAWTKDWTIVNACTGSFSVTVKTPSGTGIAIPSGITERVRGDGTNVVKDSTFLRTNSLLSEITALGASGMAAALGNLNITAALNTANGYISIPLMVGGVLRTILIQFGNSSIAATSGSVTYPVAFPNKVMSLSAVKYSNAQRAVSVNPDSLTAFNVYGWIAASGASYVDAFSWIAIGY